MFVEPSVGHLVEPVSGRRWSPADIHVQVEHRARRNAARGMRPGDRVFLHFGNRLEFFAELLAIWRLGACAIPIDARLTAFEVGQLALAARARFSIVDDTTPGDTLSAVAGLEIIDTLDTSSAGEQQDDPVASPFALDDDALILFTSGSTGDPKGVVHTHRSLRARWITLRQSLGIKAYRRTLCVLPTHFGHGLICNCLYPWLSGCDIYIAPPFQPALLMQLGALLDEHDITFLSSVPSVWNLALKAAAPPKKSGLERVHIGSAPLSAAVWSDVQAWSGTPDVYNAYGITETGSWVAGTTGGPVVPADGLIGEPWGATIAVTQSHAADAPPSPDQLCAPGEAGMVWLNTPGLMKGYFQRPDLTRAVINQGWFMTGDIGVIDDRGQLVLRGRERDEINKGGMKIFPADIDAVVERFSGATDTCAFGYPDDQYGENVAAAVVLGDAPERLFPALLDWMQSHLAEHKRPVRWYVLDEIPRTSRGKINREKVMQACLERQPFDIAQRRGVDES